MNNKLVLVKGCSGSGKSTRVYKLLEELSLGEQPTPLFYEDKQIGLSVNNQDRCYTFLGRVQKKNNTWQGYDAVTKYFGSSERTTKFVVDYLSNVDNTTLIIEGAGTTLSHRWRPEYLTKLNVFDVCSIFYYNYNLDEYDCYAERVFTRTNKLPSSLVMWKKNKGFLDEFKKTIIELQNLSLEQRQKFIVGQYSHKEGIDHLYNLLLCRG